MDHVIELIIGFFLLVVVWFIFGGPQHDIAREGVFLRPLAPIDSGTAYGGKYLNPNDGSKTGLILPKTFIDVKGIEQFFSNFFKNIKSVKNETNFSYISKGVIIDGKGGATSDDPNKEYIRLIANEKNSQSVSVSGLTLKSDITNQFGSIPLGISLPIVGQINKEENISLSPGDRIIVTTSESPIGASFRINMCSGYLGQFQNFTPELRQECPSPKNEFDKSPAKNDSLCRQFVETIPKCTTFIGLIPENLSNECYEFVTKSLTYNGCVALHQTDKGFFGNEWRVFLKKTSELWKNSQEILRLIDSKGNAIDAITY